MIVRWGLSSVAEVLGELGLHDPLLVSTPRWRSLPLPLDIADSRRFFGAMAHAEVAGVRGATEAASGADSLLALGGGSAIDTAKAVSAESTLPVVSIPTTYSGAEWTEFFGSRDLATATKRSGTHARVRAIVYEPRLTLDLPVPESGGTALNALAHCAEALYTRGHHAEADRDALEGAHLISTWLPEILQGDRFADIDARSALLRGAMHAGAALTAGMGVAHAMAQALGGRYGLPHGAMNAVCLPPALRFNQEVARAALDRLAEAMGVDDAVGRVEELASMAGPTRLRDYGVASEDLGAIASSAAPRPAAVSNPRPVSEQDVLSMLQSAW